MRQCLSSTRKSIDTQQKHGPMNTDHAKHGGEYSKTTYSQRLERIVVLAHTNSVTLTQYIQQKYNVSITFFLLSLPQNGTILAIFI